MLSINPTRSSLGVFCPSVGSLPMHGNHVILSKIGKHGLLDKQKPCINEYKSSNLIIFYIGNIIFLNRISFFAADDFGRLIFVCYVELTNVSCSIFFFLDVFNKESIWSQLMKNKLESFRTMFSCNWWILYRKFDFLIKKRNLLFSIIFQTVYSIYRRINIFSWNCNNITSLQIVTMQIIEYVCS